MKEKDEKTEVIVFGGGCFWCTEAVFQSLKGVRSVDPGYAGGDTENPTYNEVAGGETGHAESVRLAYDPKKVSFRDLLTVFFASHDPTSLNKQGADIGTQYRSAVFYTTNEQKEEIDKFIREINESSSTGKPVVTEVKPLDKFYEAEKEHKDYYERNKGQAYCQVVINPKLEKVQKQFARLLKETSN